VNNLDKSIVSLFVFDLDFTGGSGAIVPDFKTELHSPVFWIMEVKIIIAILIILAVVLYQPIKFLYNESDLKRNVHIYIQLIKSYFNEKNH